MRLLLDADLSPKRIGVLVRRGYDVVSLASDVALGGLDDPEVLALAAEQDRIPRDPQLSGLRPAVAGVG